MLEIQNNGTSESAILTCGPVLRAVRRLFRNQELLNLRRPPRPGPV